MAIIQLMKCHTASIERRMDIPVGKSSYGRIKKLLSRVRNARDRLDPFRDQAVKRKGILKRNIGWAIDEIRKGFLRIGLLSQRGAEHIKPFLDPKDRTFFKKVIYFNARILVSGKSIPDEIIIDLFSKR
ncbi:MAG: hypothetical protein BWY42_01491 [Candidatus Omnitrophica bacterium ADurb.Bin277]|nr:MAG: hypothetical protein BWY42_01491 [Candidatus Omnitrophica bacterium ADurb.Bin277]